MDNSLNITTNWDNIEDREFEIVERKGLGHPDTLADGLADFISIKYSKYCLDKFGVIPHHNLDKVYIGGGHFTCDYGSLNMYQPIKVVVNGRISNCFGESLIDVKSLQENASVEYLSRILPYLNPNIHLLVLPNATQHTQRKNWFSPKDLSDMPEINNLMANDTSLCVAHAPLTMCEMLAIGIEQSLWIIDRTCPSRPRWKDIGQDVKVMVRRDKKTIKITVCLPLISSYVSNWQNYVSRIDELEIYLKNVANSLIGDKDFDVSVGVNSIETGRRLYMLGIGSCIECGEEGIVGRGNSISGTISSNRIHSMEAPYGKNPVYHTGRVLGYLTHRLAWGIFQEINLPCTVQALTTMGHPLISADNLLIELPGDVEKDKILSCIDKYFLNVNYIDEILSIPFVFLNRHLIKSF